MEVHVIEKDEAPPVKSWPARREKSRISWTTSAVHVASRVEPSVGVGPASLFFSSFLPFLLSLFFSPSLIVFCVLVLVWSPRVVSSFLSESELGVEVEPVATVDVARLSPRQLLPTRGPKPLQLIISVSSPSPLA